MTHSPRKTDLLCRRLIFRHIICRQSGMQSNASVLSFVQSSVNLPRSYYSHSDDNYQLWARGHYTGCRKRRVSQACCQSNLLRSFSIIVSQHTWSAQKWIFAVLMCICFCLLYRIFSHRTRLLETRRSCLTPRRNRDYDYAIPMTPPSLNWPTQEPTSSSEPREQLPESDSEIFVCRNLDLAFRYRIVLYFCG
jgi:hypothetical protein